ncbi:MAG: hypothetical protein IKK11_05940 [Oscillospiraceae bacterium]|nr:hypothetical protein [Oscillospiraceae bacterium]
MKKTLSLFVCILLILGLTIPAFAAGLTVPFTDDSLSEVGGTLTVDKNAMLDSGSITSELYNALLDGNMIYSWYKNGTLTQEGTGADANSYKVTLSDQGCTIYVKVNFYEDSSFQESKKCGEAVSKEVTIIGPTPKITTKSLADATVGKEYYLKLECSDPDAVFSEFMGCQLAEFGLCLTQHGEIEGTPTKAGNCHINVRVLSEGGGENSVSFDLTVKAETEPPQATPTTTPQTEPESTNSAPTETTPAEIQPQTQNPATAKEDTFPWWGYAVIILGGMTAGIGIAFILIKRKKKS